MPPLTGIFWCWSQVSRTQTDNFFPVRKLWRKDAPDNTWGGELDQYLDIFLFYSYTYLEDRTPTSEGSSCSARSVSGHLPTSISHLDSVSYSSTLPEFPLPIRDSLEPHLYLSSLCLLHRWRGFDSRARHLWQAKFGHELHWWRDSLKIVLDLSVLH